MPNVSNRAWLYLTLWLVAFGFLIFVFQQFRDDETVQLFGQTVAGTEALYLVLTFLFLSVTLLAQTIRVFVQRRQGGRESD